MSISTRSIQEWLGIALVPSLFYSTALTTICIAGYFLLALPKISEFRKCPWHLGVWSLIWIQVVISGINTEQIDNWHTRLFLKLPFLILPVAFYALPRFSKKYIYDVHLWLLVVIWATVIPVLAQYFISQEHFLDLLGRGQAIPTPIHHVLYGMIMSYAIVSNGYILLQNKNANHPRRSVIISAAIGLFIIQHFLAIRTGLLVSYISIPVVLWMTLGQKKIVVIAIAGLIGGAIVGSQTIPSLQHRIAYMKYDLEQFRSGQGMAYADSERLYSLQKGIQVWKCSPIMGVGIGDLRSEMQKSGIDKFPHSQWVTAMAGSGLLGLVLVLSALLIPFFFYKGIFKGLLVLLYINLFSCLTIDFVLEHSVIVAFLNFFGLMLLTKD